jgi:hypothetical protein
VGKGAEPVRLFTEHAARLKAAGLYQSRRGGRRSTSAGSSPGRSERACIMCRRYRRTGVVQRSASSTGQQPATR